MNKVQADTKRVNFHIPEALYTAIKVKAAQNGNTFTQEMIKAAKDSLKEPVDDLTPNTMKIIKRIAENNGVDMDECVRDLISNAYK